MIELLQRSDAPDAHRSAPSASVATEALREEGEAAEGTAEGTDAVFSAAKSSAASRAAPVGMNPAGVKPAEAKGRADVVGSKREREVVATEARRSTRDRDRDRRAAGADAERSVAPNTLLGVTQLIMEAEGLAVGEDGPLMAPEWLSNCFLMAP